MNATKPIVVTAPATVVAVPPPPESLPKVGDKNIPPTTTEQEDIVTAGQRRVNLVWEYTQSFVTIVVVLANMAVAVTNGVTGKSLNEHPTVLSTSLFLILGFYYSRTNHSAIGGVGKKAGEQYVGR